MKDFEDTVLWVNAVYPELASHLYKSSDEFFNDLKSRDDFPNFPSDDVKKVVKFMYDSYAKELKKWSEKLWTRDVTDVMMNKTIESESDLDLDYQFWNYLKTGAKADPKTGKTRVQDIILQAQNDVVDYAFEMLDIGGYLQLSAPVSYTHLTLPTTSRV